VLLIVAGDLSPDTAFCLTALWADLTSEAPAASLFTAVAADLLEAGIADVPAACLTDASLPAETSPSLLAEGVVEGVSSLL
jgi:hypothetical protein